MPQAQHLQHRVESGYIQIVANGSYIPAFWAHPRSGGPFPGLVLLHDDWGLSAHTRAAAYRLAEIGYYVIAPDLFAHHLPSNPVEANALEIYYLPLATPKVDAAIAALESHHKCNNKLAIIGWDIGGTLVFDSLIRRADVMAGVAFYGNPSAYFKQFEYLKSPVLAIYGQEDELLKQHEKPLLEAFKRSPYPHQLVTYPNVGHDFYNERLPGYNVQAADGAWIQFLNFLETHQGKPPAPTEAHLGQFKTGSVY